MGGSDDDSDDEDDEEEATEAELSAMNVAKLKELCKERDLSDKGNIKAELVARLLADGCVTEREDDWGQGERESQW